MDKIQYNTDQGIAHITMDDGKVNAMDFVSFEEMGNALDRAEGDGAKALIITGRPGYFSAGLDMKLIPTLSQSEFSKLGKALARTLLRIFSLPFPTVNICSGHAVAGGAMLCFACDVRFVVDGPFRLQMNEMLIGIPLPSWMLLIGRSAIPVPWLVDTLLHARAYTPTEAVEKGIFHELIKNGEDPLKFAKGQIENLNDLNPGAYETTKKRLREADTQHVLELLETELPS